ncbi:MULTISPECIES: DUF3179 domain-containing protein [unclassified Halorubrum]|jgi:hypothetical protein|uniref:DUF3179 domain-containing protein n=1 Tax=unclassified Halorubrum TaxID=2642239 RepID=UPI0010F8902F|nr:MULTISPECIES: DUF3179 domain-containing protein [unclassified Halorubrum]TKX42508.1 DUF3179 domain-containing protein [Halorubrum sp. ARQ200]TKX49897.1 DUF3179 domain-containing protein [Halorubrum sp. ASP121]
MNRTRRAALSGLAAVGAAVAGCLGGRATSGADRDGESAGASSDGASGGDGSPPPTVETEYHLAYEPASLLSESLDGGVGKDGIPSVDDPQFRPIADADLAADEPVFGVVRDGEARAYPRRILSHHEIVNDEIAGEPIAVTYCPLTGTAQGFRRGATTFGVSGRLVNSNLIMYDRATDSWWPQMLATAIDGPLAGATLDEFRVVWTTASEWAARRPGSLVMTEATGHVRRYDSDPYGSYAPVNGYYARNGTLFPPLASTEDGHPKSVVVGARTADGAVAFDKATLLDERVLTGTVGGDGAAVVAVAEPALSTGHVYRNPDGAAVATDGDGYRVGGEGGLAAADLPLDRVLAFDAMWFAWAGFYPDTAFVGDHTWAGYGR